MALTIFMSGAALGRLPSIDRGSCVTRDGVEIDMRDLEFFVGDQIVMETKSGRMYASINGDQFVMSRDREGKDIVGVIDVPFAIEKKDRLDISLSLVELENKHYLYWKETFLNRRARQGLFEYSPDKLSKYCEGSFGSGSIP